MSSDKSCICTVQAQARCNWHLISPLFVTVSSLPTIRVVFHLLPPNILLKIFCQCQNSQNTLWNLIVQTVPNIPLKRPFKISMFLIGITCLWIRLNECFSQLHLGYFYMSNILFHNIITVCATYQNYELVLHY